MIFKNKAFTMIELIFVIVIIGIISSIEIPQFTAIVDSSKQNVELYSISTIENDLEWSKQSYVDISIINWNGDKDTNESTFDFDKDGNEEIYSEGKLLNLHFDNADENVTDKDEISFIYNYISKKRKTISKSI